MKKCVVLLSFIVSTILVLASCAAETTTTTPKSITPLTTTPSGTTKPSTTTAASETPQYGGVVIIPLAQDILNFEEMYGWHPGAALLKLTNEELVTGDWTRGPAGTNECDWAIRGTDRFSQKAGALAESWEYPEMGKAIYHPGWSKIRHNYRCVNNPISVPDRQDRCLRLG